MIRMIDRVLFLFSIRSLSIIHASVMDKPEPVSIKLNPEPVIQHLPLRTRIFIEENASEMDPLEWMPDSWMDGGIGLERVLERMQREPAYRLEFHQNCAGLSFAEVDLILRKVRPSFWDLFLSVECLEGLNPSAWYAFTQKYMETGHLAWITLERVISRSLVSSLHVSGLTYLLERHIREQGLLNQRFTGWILEVEGKWQLKPEDWKTGLAWEAITPQVLWSAYHAQRVWPTLINILVYFPSNPTESSLREALHRLLHLQHIERFLRRIGCDDEILYKLLGKAQGKVETRMIKIHEAMIAHDQERFMPVAVWAAHLNQARRKYASGPREALPRLSLPKTITTMLSMEDESGDSRFGRRWCWRILETGLLGGAAVIAKELSEFLRRVGPNSVIVEEVESMIRGAKEAEDRSVWAVLVRELRGNRQVSWMLSMMNTETIKKQAADVNTAPSEATGLFDCAIQ